MIRITPTQIGLVAGAASMLSSAIHGFFQAISSVNFDSIFVMVAYSLGRVIGDLPIALVCFGLAFVVSNKRNSASDT